MSLVDTISTSVPLVSRSQFPVPHFPASFLPFCVTYPTNIIKEIKKNSILRKGRAGQAGKGGRAGAENGKKKSMRLGLEPRRTALVIIQVP